MYADQHLWWYMLHVSRKMMMHNVLNSGLRMVVYCKDMRFEVGLTHWEVIHSSTPEALEKVSPDALQRGFGEAKHSSFPRRADPGVEGGSSELTAGFGGVQTVKSPQLGDRMTLGGNKCVISSLRMETPQQVCEGNADPPQTTSSLTSLRFTYWAV